ncbi:MAG TPA: DUF6176 family protein [Anaerolineales bacterium]|nr:DUF6176 family protein [Anaerolineales bacterium]HRF47273.1 DUF6176 family protein [Anaerolineales bacterium]
MRVELSRFRVLPGKAERVDAWLQMLNDRMPETLATLEREEMQFEVIFREVIGDDQFLTWVSVQGEAGADVETSPHEVDHLHLDFWRECIDETHGRHDAQPQAVMVPPRVAAAMNWPDPAGSRVPFEPREIVYRRRSSAA